MFITGPEVIKTVTGEDVSFEQLGGAMTHATKSGVAHFVAENEQDCLAQVRYLMSFLPSNNLEEPPHFPSTDDPEPAVLCDRSARCTVNVLWVRVRDAVTGALDSMTLADLVPPRVSEPASPSPIQPTPLQGAMTTT